PFVARVVDLHPRGDRAPLLLPCVAVRVNVSSACADSAVPPVAERPRPHETPSGPLGTCRERLFGGPVEFDAAAVRGSVVSPTQVVHVAPPTRLVLFAASGDGADHTALLRRGGGHIPVRAVSRSATRRSAAGPAARSNARPAETGAAKTAAGSGRHRTSWPSSPSTASAHRSCRYRRGTSACPR